MARKIGKRQVESQGLLLRSQKQDQLCAGLDEAGRGCLAGPVVAAAVIFAEGFDLVGLGDSKSLSASQREDLALEIRQMAVGWGIGSAWLGDIAKHNILQASLLAMTRALLALRIRLKIAKNEVGPSQILLDGNQLIPPHYFRLYHIPLPEQRAIVGGDATVPSISAASILAKTYRDELMTRLDLRWPQYGFAKHKGYGTKEHRAAIQEYGPCSLHRQDFRGVKPENSQVQGTLF